MTRTMPHRVVVAAALLLVGGAVYAEGNSAEVSIVSQTSTSTVFEVQTSGLDTSTVIVGSDTFTRLSIIGGYEALLDTGKPEVPRVPVMLAVPTGAECEIAVESVHVRELSIRLVYPQQPMRDWSDTSSTFVWDKDFYELDTVWPDSATYAVSVSRGLWRQLDVATFSVFPVHVNPGKGTVELADYIRIKVAYSGGAYPSAVEHWMCPAYAANVDNLDQLHLEVQDNPYVSGTRLLVFRYADYSASSGLLQLLNWVQQRGYEYEVIDGRWPSAADTSAILSAIRAEYFSHSPPVLRWVLLVGDAYPAEITLASKWSNNYLGDYPYSCVTASPGGHVDLFPDVGVARLSPRSPANLDSIAWKILDYDLSTSQADTWLDRVTYVAHKDSSRGRGFPAITRGVATMPYYSYWQPDKTVIIGDTGDNRDVRSAVESGTGLLAYIGHGDSTTQSWGRDKRWSATHNYNLWNCDTVRSLADSGRRYVALLFACDLAYQGNATENMCEAWLRKNPGGAVATYGATGTLYPPMATSCSAAIRAICDTCTVAAGNTEYDAPSLDLGAMIMYVQAYFVKRWVSGNDTEKQACLVRPMMFGDPTMQIWAGTPESAEVAGLPPDTVDPEPLVLDINVRLKDGRTVSRPYACARGPGIYTAAYGNDTGYVSLSLPAPPLPGGWVTITITEGHATTSPHTPMLPYVDTFLMGLPRWAEMESLPRPPGTNKNVKRGGWLAHDTRTSVFHAAKGNSSYEFYAFDLATGHWSPRWHIPLGREGKLPKDGCKGTSDDNGHIYMVKGNNTYGFWRYDVAGDSWTQLADVPPGERRRRVRSGSDVSHLCIDGHDYVYLIRDRDDFCRYDVQADSWQTCATMPATKWRDGSWLLASGDSMLYAHRAEYDQLWTYNTLTDAWNDGPGDGVPFTWPGGRSRKSKAGGSAAWFNGYVYALKGSRTQEVWRLDPATGLWTAADTVPRCGSSGLRREVYRGGDIAGRDYDGIYILKGNNTREFWRYSPPPDSGSAFYGSGLFGVAGSGGAGQDGEAPFADGIEGLNPRWSNDGKSVCYSSEDDDGWLQIYTMTYPGGKERQLTFGHTDHERPVFHPSGNGIACQVFDTLTCCYQLARVSTGATPIVTVLTSSAYDHTCPEWNLQGTGLVYQRDDGSYEQLFLIGWNGGPEMQLTTDEADHEEPSYLDDTTVVFTYSPNDGYDQIYSVNTRTQVQRPLTQSPYDRENVNPATDRRHVSYQFWGDDGVSQIAMTTARGDSEVILSKGNTDMEEPDWSQDNQTIYCVNWVGLGSEIGRIDVPSQTWTALTDGEAVRDNPDVYCHTPPGVNDVVYEREVLGQPKQGDGGRRRGTGNGIWLVRDRNAGDGVMAQASFPLALERVRPNPASGRVMVRFQIPTEGNVSLKVYNTAGQAVATLLDQPQKPGRYALTWDGRDNHERTLSSGVYFVALEAAGKRLKQKVVLAQGSR